MRPRDLPDYLRMRRFAANAWQTLRFCKRQPQGVTHVVRLRDGRQLPLRADRADAHMFHRIFVQDEYELAPLEPKGLGDVVDLGGNVGLFALRAADFSRRVISYEPSSVNFACLAANTEGRARVETIRAAVSSRSGTVRLYRPRSERLSGVYSTHPDFGGHMSAEHEDVSSLTLHDLFERHQIERCDLLKIDVEGQEYDILYACSAEDLARIGRIHGEYHDVEQDDPRTRIDRFAAFLSSHGFQVRLRPHRRKPNHGLFWAVKR